MTTPPSWSGAPRPVSDAPGGSPVSCRRRSARDPRTIGPLPRPPSPARGAARRSSTPAISTTRDSSSARWAAPAPPRPAHPPPPGDLALAFRADRDARRVEHEVLTRLVVPVEEGWRVALARAPDVAAACEEALGPMPEGPGLLPLRDLLGIVGAHEWRRRGVEVPALGARASAVRRLRPRPRRVRGPRRSRSGGVARRGQARLRRGHRHRRPRARPRARRRARDRDRRRARRGRLRDRERRAARPSDRVVAVQADLFPEDAARADLVVSNPPWLPADAASPLERAVYDPGGKFVERLVLALPGRLAPGGRRGS